MSNTRTTRRSFVRSGAAVAVGATALTVAASASAESEYDGYLDDVGNYDGTVVDETGADQVTIAVGADGNGGPFTFDPPAVQVTPGTTVVWEWVAELHNVVDEDGAFESEMTDEAGHTFEYTVESPGVTQYYCGPHKSMGMKGVIDVVEEQAEAGGDGAGGEGSGNGDGQGDGTDAGDGASGGTGTGGTGNGVGPAIPSVIALAFVLPAAYAALANRSGGDDGPDGE